VGYGRSSRWDFGIRVHPWLSKAAFQVLVDAEYEVAAGARAAPAAAAHDSTRKPERAKANDKAAAKETPESS